MGGYRWLPQFRLTPPNGGATTIDLVSALLTAPNAGPMAVGLEYELDRSERMTVNRVLRSSVRGLRPSVSFSILDGGEMNDSDVVAQIITALLDPAWTVEVSLDSVTFRACELSKGPKVTPNQRKTGAGCTWEFTVTCKELVTSLTPLRQGTW